MASRSPWLHEQEARAQGLELSYELFDFTERGLDDAELGPLLRQLAAELGLSEEELQESLLAISHSSIAALDELRGATAKALDVLKAAGATEVVPEVVEGSLMLASHALALMNMNAKYADVIKLEEPKGGDIARTNLRDQKNSDSLFFLSFNANKRSVELDTTEPNPANRGVNIVLKLDTAGSSPA